VNSSSAFKLFLIFVCLGSIAWKIANFSYDQSASRNDVVKFLESNHFDIELTDDSILATTASCSLQVAYLEPDGSDQDRFRTTFATGKNHLFVVFRGRLYSQQPIFWTAANYLWSKRLRELGFIKYITPVIGVAATSSCDAEKLPWNEVR
jgi:hypothetical protein